MENKPAYEKLVNSIFSDSEARILEVEYSGVSADEDAKKYSSKITDNIKIYIQNFFKDK